MGSSSPGGSEPPAFLTATVLAAASMPSLVILTVTLPALEVVIARFHDFALPVNSPFVASPVPLVRVISVAVIDTSALKLRVIAVVVSPDAGTAV